MTPLDLGITIFVLLAGIVATWLVTRWYYMKGYGKIKRRFDSLDGLHLAETRIKEGNGFKEGTLRKNPDGTWEVDWHKSRFDSLEGLHLAEIRIKEGSGFKEGTLRKNPDGTWEVDWHKVIIEQDIPVSGSVSPEVRPGRVTETGEAA